MAVSSRAVADGRLPTSLEMTPADKPGQKTVLLYRSLRFNVPLNLSCYPIRFTGSWAEAMQRIGFDPIMQAATAPAMRP
ncbi:outer membrane lipoprotein-sorting protein [Hymenobacter sp. BT770]|uniref:outer membrane lipoprotein-sorting protein n=1 Tax=Hymenobacter sp. BT770 TaxID=2886942 RepID=UPI001D0FC541|nr:outer membrane lipoprotein-sorting protein [Hymenobacter sp. BT770]MCC3152323.1 outer membrane lipoprotein-sorting protein [Hymenobacter sp. BT770]MDO3414136.1 outer membrane lipoprotein-sorting protein [Hymenobacter sp. BT770]